MRTDGYGYGDGYGSGDGFGFGSGDGYGDGFGSGDGYGYGYGYGGGDGHGDGYGFGFSDGYGDGYGYGFSDGYGYGNVDHATPILAWHYVPADGHLRYPLPGGARPRVTPGLVIEYPADEIELCTRGLHASIDRADAAKFCNGVLTRVACSGRVIMSRDKLVCSRRVVVEVYPRDEAER